MKSLMKLLAFGLVFLSSYSFAQLNWTLKKANGSDTQIQNNDRVLLVNNSNNSPLKYGKRSAKSRALSLINIVWGATTEGLSSSNFVNIVRQPGASGPIKTGERVALRFQEGGYLKYANKTLGVNLEWVSSNTSNVPYIFEIRYLDNKIDQIVTTNREIGVFCHEAGDWLVYCERPTDPGINLGWPASCSGCSRGGFDWTREYFPKSKKILGDVQAHKLDGEDLSRWCTGF
jgi:hypothetical protein